MWALYFHPVVSSSLFFYLFFPRLISAVAEWMSTILLHWCGLSANLEYRSEMCCTRLTGNTGRKNRHLRPIAQLCRAESSQLRHVSTIGKKLVKQQYVFTCPHNMANFGTLVAETGSGIWGTPANFNGFRILLL